MILCYTVFDCRYRIPLELTYQAKTPGVQPPPMFSPIFSPMSKRRSTTQAGISLLSPLHHLPKSPYRYTKKVIDVKLTLGYRGVDTIPAVLCWGVFNWPVKSGRSVYAQASVLDNASSSPSYSTFSSRPLLSPDRVTSTRRHTHTHRERHRERLEGSGKERQHTLDQCRIPLQGSN
jgi:hypothetical protein